MTKKIYKTKIIDSIQVTREIEREVTVKRKFKEQVDVTMLQLNEDDIRSLDDVELLKAVACGFQKLFNEYYNLAHQQQDIIRDISEPATLDTAIKDEVVIDDSDEEKETIVEHPRRHRAGGSNDALIGRKHETATSIYHYTFWNKNRKLWCNLFTSDTFESELDCAHFIDSHLDEIGDTKKARNFPKELQDEQ